MCLSMGISRMRALKTANETEEEEVLPGCLPHKDSSTLRVQVAAHGYDIWKSDPFAEVSGDPGQKNRIFHIQCTNLNTAKEGYYDFFSAYPDYSCRKTFSRSTLKTFKDYVTAISLATEYSDSISAEASGGAYGVSLSASAKYKKSGNSALAKTRRLFEEKYGEIRIATAVCKTYDVRIDTNWLRPKFSRNFIAALESLEATLTESDSSQQATVKKFINSFGTHIMTEVDFGAKMLYEKRFTAKSTSAKASNKRQECVKESVSGCVGGGYKGPVVKVSAKACAGSNNGQCTNDEFDNSWGEMNSYESTKLRTIGSPLSSETDWGEDDTFHPVPIRRKLELISTMFTAANLQKSQFYGLRKSLDHQGIKRIFNKVAGQYCTLVLGKSAEECTEELSGCGLNDNCGYEQQCKNDKTKPHGYICKDQVELLTTIDGWSFYKIYTEGKMTPQNIRRTCLENGMTPACLRPYQADSGCTTTPNNGNTNTQYALSEAVCPNEDWVSCQAMNYGFWYTADNNGKSYGVHNGKYTNTKTLTSLWSMCTKQD